MAVEPNVSFDIYNKESVKLLQENDPDILPTYSVAESKDLSYNKKQVNSAITSAIIQGKSIDSIADDLQSRISSLNRNSAIAAARTGITCAQNAGSLSSMKELAAMGIEVQKEWVATLDDRTRESHRMLDGERRDLDERFSNGLMYPGASGSASETWRCRCTIVSYLPDVDNSDAVRWSRDSNTNQRGYVPNITYNQWLSLKSKSNNRFNKRASQFSSSADPMEEVTGSAYESNPKEIAQIKDYLKAIGVEINEDSESIGYGCTSLGKPGVLSINKLASYSAWLHELQHIEDDKESGWRGIAVLFDAQERIEWETRAYQKEIENALKLGRNDIADRLRENLKNEIRKIEEAFK